VLRRLPNPPGTLRAQLAVLRYRHLLLLRQPARCSERLSNAAEMLQRASALGKDDHWCMAFLLRQTELLQAGDLMRAETSTPALFSASRATDKAIFAEVLDTWTTMRALIDGRFEEAFSGAQRFVGFAEKILPDTAVALFLPAAATMLQELDRLGEIVALAERAVAAQPWLVVLRATLARIRLSLGDVEEARSTLNMLLAQGFEEVQSNAALPLYLATLAELSSELDERSHAAELYDRLLAYEPYNIVLGPIVFAGPAARYLGILATLQNRFAEAEKHFLQACRFSSRTAARPWLAYTEIDYARMLMMRDTSEDRELAGRFIDSAFKTAQALNMAALMRKADELKMQLESAQPQLAPQNSCQESSHPMVRDDIESEEFSQAAECRVPTSVAEQSVECSQLCSGMLKREGDYWTVVVDKKTIRLKHTKGLDMIAWLLRYPRREFLALTLERLAAGGLSAEAALTAVHFTRELGGDAETDDSGTRLDPTGKSCLPAAPGGTAGKSFRGEVVQRHRKDFEGRRANRFSTS
jgi:tetratricopeptide (TPR) repeat protein